MLSFSIYWSWLRMCWTSIQMLCGIMKMLIWNEPNEIGLICSYNSLNLIQSKGAPYRHLVSASTSAHFGVIWAWTARSQNVYVIEKLSEILKSNQRNQHHHTHTQQIFVHLRKHTESIGKMGRNEIWLLNSHQARFIPFDKSNNHKYGYS